MLDEGTFCMQAASKGFYELRPECNTKFDTVITVDAYMLSRYNSHELLCYPNIITGISRIKN